MTITLRIGALLVGPLLFNAGLVRAGEGVPLGMVLVEGGSYVRPLEREGKPREVASFYLDVDLVTNAQFLAFVARQPKWQRSRVNGIFADKSYLRHWRGDLDLGPGAPPEAPVTNVSWFAARAFLQSVGKRLPTVDEWEYAARADETSRNAARDPAFKKRILEWYGTPTAAVHPPVTSGYRNVYGVRGMHGLVWEWTRDFNSVLATGESRADGSPDAALFCGGGGLNQNSATEYADFMRFAMRSAVRGNYAQANLGFRGAADLAAKEAGAGNGASGEPETTSKPSP